MTDVFQNTDRMWFGTRERMQWIETPRSGANVSTSGTFAEADLINGGAFVRNSVDAHKNYAFTWGDSADRRLASIIRSYRNGSYGGGPIYFSDPMYYETNLFSQRWADPSMALKEEAPTLTGDIGTLSSIPTAPNPHGLPITSAVYQFGSITNWTGEQDSAFHLEIPEGMELVVGAYYTATGGARIALRHNGFQRTELPQHSVSDKTCMDTIIGPGGSVDVYLESGASPNGTLTIAGMIARLRPVGSGGGFDGQTVTNLFTNPNLEGDGEWVNMGENLFTNPNLVGDGTYAEVRRNLLKVPLISASMSGWAASSGVLNVGPVAGGREFSTTATITPASGILLRGHGDVAAEPGEAFSGSAVVRNIGSAPISLALSLIPSSGSTNLVVIPGPSVTIPPGASGSLVSEGHVMPAGTTNVRFAYIAGDTGVPSGSSFVIEDHPTLERAPVSGGRFDGSTPDFTVDPDMRQRWLGAENASESVMEIENAAGFTAINVIAGVTTSLPRKLRLISTKAAPTGNPSYARIDVPAAARSEGTLLGTAILHEPVANPIGAYQAALVVAAPTHSFPNPPNEAGEYPQRLVFSNLSSAYQARFYHGGLLGDADVYWTDIGLFAGDYQGQAFSGSRLPEPISDPDKWRVSWLGAEDNSVSRLERLNTRSVVAENLFTNPRLKGDGTWAEVRRNRIINPILSDSLDGWSPSTLATMESAPGVGCKVTVNSSISAHTHVLQVSPAGNYAAVTEGDIVRSIATVSVPSDAPRAIPLRTRLAIRDSGGVTGTDWYTGSEAWIAPGESHTFVEEREVQPGLDRAQFAIMGSSAQPLDTGDVFILHDGATVEINSPYAPTPIAPGVPLVGVSQPEDFRVRWLGTPNASESVMEIERVAGLTASNCIAGVSTWDGKPAVRIIPTGSGLSMAYAIIPATASSVTLVGTVSLDAPLQGTLSNPALTLGGGGVGDSAPNLAGDHPLRVMGGEPSGGYVAFTMTNGATLGHGDVWWTDIGLYAGTYNDGAFHGSSDPSDVDIAQPEDFTYRWTGAVDNSTSVMEVENVAGLTGVRCVAGVSTWDGKPAARLIPNSTTNFDSYASVMVSSGFEGTALGTIHQDKPLSGALKSDSNRIITVTNPWGVYSPIPPNLEGSYPQRLAFPPRVTNGYVRFNHGGYQGSGDVWWTGIGLFAGEYDGPWVDGTWTFPASGEMGSGEWFVGEGHSGCRFLGSPAVYNNDGIGGGRVSLSCDLRETGAWE